MKNNSEKIKVLADFHHAGLLNSLIMLFENRLGGELYRPIGTEWHEQGYWRVYDHPATVQQYLGIGGATPDGSPKLNEVVTTSKTPDPIYFCHDIDSDQTNKAITLSKFMSMPFNVVIASIPHHIEPFKRLCANHPNHPKLIYQIGNNWTTGAGLAPNIMASAKINNVPQDINYIEYHQEFDTTLFSYTPPKPGNVIASYVNCFSTADYMRDDWQLFVKMEKVMPGFLWRSYGGQCRDGCMHGAKQVAQAIKDTRFVWHTKPGGDGYGHIIHNTAAVGRPMIVKKEYYTGKLGESLMKDGETCIAIDNLSIPQIINKIEYYNEETRYQELCDNSYTNFMLTVNFEKEAENIKTFLAKLKP